MNLFIAITFASSALLLTACGDNGSGVTGGKESASFEEMVTTGTLINTSFDDQAATPQNSMPTTGTATYVGVAAFGASLQQPVEVASEARLQADFASSSISGNLTNFRDYENNLLPGSVDINGGIIDANRLQANLSGSIMTDAGAKAVLGTLDAGFIGTDATGISGYIEGSVGGESVVGQLVAKKK